MKKVITLFLVSVALTTSAFAHHMAAYEDAGIMIPDSSPHLLMEFY